MGRVKNYSATLIDILEQVWNKRWLQLLGIWLAVCLFLSLCLYHPRSFLFPGVGPIARTLCNLDYQLQDRLVDLLPAIPPLEDLVFLGIDEASLRISAEDPAVVQQERGLQLMAAPYPWSRELWALTVERLLEAGARLVILDLIFSTPREGDLPLRSILEAHPDRVLLISSIEARGKFQGAGSLLQHSEPVETVLSDFGMLENNVGYANFFPDPDGVVRSLLHQTTLIELQGGTPHPDEIPLRSLTAAALRLLTWQEEVPESARLLQLRFPNSPATSYPVYPLYEIFWPDLWTANYSDGEFFRDKVVLVGPAANQFQDIHTTPVGDLLGPQLHLSAITSAKSGGLFQRAPLPANAILLFLFGSFAGFLLLRSLHPLRTVIGLFLAGVLFLVLAWVSLRHFDSLLSVLGPSGALFSIGGIGLALESARIYRERSQLRRSLERRVSREVVEEILGDPHSYLNELGGMRREVCVLFSDLRGFTAMTESSSPEKVLNQLNDYFDVMVSIIQAERGMVDKFIGDAIMAIWGSIPAMDRATASRSTVSAALQMNRALPELNRSFASKGMRELRIGIGAHSGEAITGNLGSEKRLELTAIGDTVNLASRLEGVTKAYGVPLIISDAVVSDLGEGWIHRPVDRVRVVGRKAPLTMYEPLALPGDDLELRSICESKAEEFAASFASYQARDFQSAVKGFERYLSRTPDDKPASILLDRCRDYLDQAPPDDWDGSISLTSK